MSLRGIPTAHPRVVWLILVLVITAQGVGSAWVELPAWLGWAPTTGPATELATIFGSPIVCVTATWLASHPSAFRYDHLVALGPSGPKAYRVLIWSYSTSIGSVGYLLTATTLVALSLIVGGGFSGPLLTWLLSAAAVLANAAVWAAVGVGLARLRPTVLALVAAALLPYGLYVIVAYQTSGPLLALALTDFRDFSYVTPDPTAWAARAALWLALATAGFALLVGARRLRTAAWCVASLAAAVTILGGTRVVAIPDAESPVCLGDELITCVDVAHRAASQDYAAHAREAVEVLPEDLRPAAVVQNPGLAPSSVPRGEVVVIEPMSGVTQPARSSDRALFLDVFGGQLFDAALCPRARHERNLTTRAALIIWWREQHGLAMDGSDTVGSADLTLPEFDAARLDADSFSDLTPADRAQWLRENLGRLRACEDVTPWRQ